MAGVVPELEILRAVGHLRVAADRIVVDEEVVRVTLDDRQTGEEGGVEERRRELAEPAPHAEAQHAVSMTGA